MSCMADQVTDTKSGIQSGLFTDIITGLRFDNRTDSLGWGTLAWPRWPQMVLEEWAIASQSKSTCPCKKAANVHVNHCFTH